MQQALKEIESASEIFIKKHQEQRDEWNAKVVENRSRREAVNGQKRELYDEIERQRSVRDKENTRVRDSKKERDVANKAYNTLRIELHGSDGDRGDRRRKDDSPAFIKKKMNDLEMDHMTGKINDTKFSDQMKSWVRKLKDLEASQTSSAAGDSNSELNNLKIACDNAHKQVLDAADAAQAAHDLMGKLKDETRRLNDEHELAHRAFVTAKVEADREHQYYIVAMRCTWSSRHLLKAIQDRADGIQPSKADASAQNVDLMSALMSGQTLSTEQLMAMQRDD